MTNIVEEFRTQLVKQLRAAGHEVPMAEARGTYWEIDGVNVEVRITENVRGRDVNARYWQSTGKLTVSIGGKYRGPSADRFRTRKDGWDWAAIVERCVWWAQFTNEADRAEKQAETTKQATLRDPRVKKAEKLLPGTSFDPNSDGTLRVQLWLTPDELLAVASVLGPKRSGG